VLDTEVRRGSQTGSKRGGGGASTHQYSVDVQTAVNRGEIHQVLSSRDLKREKHVTFYFVCFYNS